LRILFLILGVAFCLGIAVIAARWGIADSHARIAFDEMDTWRNIGVPEDGWLLAHSEMGKALELDPDHPAYLQRMGRLMLIRVTMLPDEAESFGSRGRDYLQASLKVRPQWPSAWSDLALAKQMLGEYDATLNQAIINATVYGPWEPDVQIRLAGVAAAAWDELPTEVRKAVLGNIERGFRSPVRTATGIMVKSINRDMNGVNVGFIQALGTELAGSDWSKSGENHVVGFLVQHWEVLTGAQQRLLASSIAEVVARTGNTALVKDLGKKAILGNICPYLPRQPKFRQFCVITG
jgi:hypothetical protein